MAIGNFNSNSQGVPAVTADNTAINGPGSNGLHALASSPTDSAVYGEHRGTGIGVFGRGGPNVGEGVFGQTANSSSGVYGKNQNTTAPTESLPIGNPGVTGESSFGTGVIGISHLALGVAVFGSNDAVNGIGVFGDAMGGLGTGVAGRSTDGDGVVGASRDGIGVSGQSDNSIGVFGYGVAVGVSGLCPSDGPGINGTSAQGPGVWGVSGNVAVYAHNDSAPIGNGNDAYLGTRGAAGDFHGRVDVLGKLNKFGGGFLIDHPCDAAKKYLSHSFVESPDMKNIYDGVVTLDDRGEAEIELPSWFGALNSDFRYQLTCIGGYSPVYISQEIQDNRFKIAGDAPGIRVCWQVTGIRQDRWAKANRVVVEEAKPDDEQGYYLHPEVFGESEERHIRRVRYREQAKWIEDARDLAQRLSPRRLP